MVRWLRWHCPPDTGFEIPALAVWGRARYLSVTEAPHNTDFHTWMGKKHFCFFQAAETGNRTPNSGVKGSGANHYPRAHAPDVCSVRLWRLSLSRCSGGSTIWKKGGAPRVLGACPQYFFVNCSQFRELFKVFAENSRGARLLRSPPPSPWIRRCDVTVQINPLDWTVPE